MKIRFLGLLLVSASLAVAQTPDQAQATDAGPTILSRSEIVAPLEAATGKGGDYFNFFAYGDFTYNSYEPFATYVGAASGLEGYDAGLGVNLLHYYRTGVLSLDYSGGYRGYPGLNIDPADNIIQNLSLTLNQQLSRHVTFTVNENAGWNPGGWFPQVVVTPESSLALNLAAIRYESSLTSVGLSYQQTKRLSWQVGGAYSVLIYKPSSNINSSVAQASVGVNYRITRKTTVGASTNYQYFSFLQLHGSSTTNGAYLSLSHQFGPRVEIGVSGGAVRSTYGEASSQVGGSNVSAVAGSVTTYVPFLSGRFSITRRRTSFTLSGGETVSAGNGIFLTSRMIYASGGVSYVAGRKWSFGLGGGYQRIVSIAGGPSEPVNFVNGSVDYKLARHVGVRASGSYSSYEAISAVQGHSYYNFIVGFFFTSADRPLARIF